MCGAFATMLQDTSLILTRPGSSDSGANAAWKKRPRRAAGVRPGPARAWRRVISISDTDGDS